MTYCCAVLSLVGGGNYSKLHKIMKNKILLFGLASVMVMTVAVAGFPVSGSAQSVSASAQASGLTADQVNAIITLLQSFGADQSVVTNVRISLTGGTPTGNDSNSFCYTFTHDLTVGNTGNEVAYLERALTLNLGITIVDDNKPATFSEETAAAVVRFQAKYGIRQTGYVGPLTRAQLNKLYGCGNTTRPSITVITPNGGETYAKGTTQTIGWQDKTSTTSFSPTRYDLKLAPYYPPCTGQICPAYSYVNPYTIATGVGGQSSDWYVGKIVNYDGGGGTAPDGAYTVQVCQTGTDRCDSSDSYFKITSAGSNLSPVIDGVSGPTSLSVGAAGTWSVRAHDPENGTLSYNVDWGDGAGVGGGGSTASTASVPYQTTTFTHSYSTAGSYTVRFTVRDSVGLSAQSSITVQIGGATQSSCPNSQNAYVGYAPATDASLLFEYLPNGTEDHAGQWSQFTANGSPDYNWKAALVVNSQKTIKSMLINTGYSGLSGTTGRCVDGILPWPVVVFSSNGRQLNTDYDQMLGTYSYGTYGFNIFGQKNSSDPAFRTFILVVYFTDGTYVASPPTPGTTATQRSATITSGGQTTSLTPTISGTASGVSQVGIVLSNSGGKVYGSGLVSVVNGSWSVTVSPALVVGQYMMYVYDANNNQLVSGNLNVTSSNTNQPSITVINPVAPENYIAGGQPAWAVWSSANLPASTNIDSLQFTLISSGGASYPLSVTKNSSFTVGFNGNYTNNGMSVVNEMSIPSNVPPGQYKLKIVCSSCGAGGVSAIGSSAFTVLPLTVAPSMTVTVPVTNQTAYAGGKLDVHWTTQNIAASEPIVIWAFNKDNQTIGYNLAGGPGVPNTGSYTVTLPSGMTLGQYRLQLQCTTCMDKFGTQTAVYSQVFTVAAPVSTAQPSITVTSPNGGESFVLGASIPVTWTQTFDSDSTGVYVVDTAQSTLYSSATIRSTVGNNQLTLPGNAIPSAGSYRVNICSPISTHNYCDPSNALFTVTAPTQPTVTALSPSSARPGTWIALDGTNIIDAAPITVRLFNTNYSVTVTGQWDHPGGIYFQIPTTIPVGTYEVTISNVNGTSQSYKYLQVTT